MEGWEVWNPWLVGRIIYSSGGEYRETSLRGEGFVQLPRCMHELDPREAQFHVPPAPPSLHQQRFMPPVISAFACWDIQEIPREKTVMYAQALQCIAEENNLPKRDQPWLLPESIVELRREVGFYLSFTDEEVFQGVELPLEQRSSLSVPTTPTADAPGNIDTPEMPPMPKVAPTYARWNTVVHPSWPVVAAGKTPQPTTMRGQREEHFNSAKLFPLAHHPNPQRLHHHQGLPHWPEHWH